MRPAARRPGRGRHQGRAAGWRSRVERGACSPIRRGRTSRRTCRGGSRTAGSRRWCSTSTTPPTVPACSRLVDDADVVIESFATGWLDARGIGHEALLARNPSLVVTSISPFGRTGPYADWSATDLTVAATTGELWLTGDVDRPPLRVSSEQLFLHAGAEAAVHTLVGPLARAAHRRRSARRRVGAAGGHQVPDERPGVPRPGGLRAVPLGTGLRRRGRRRSGSSTSAATASWPRWPPPVRSAGR